MKYLTAADLRNKSPSTLDLTAFFHIINCDLIIRKERGETSGEMVAEIPRFISGQTPEIYDHFKALGFEVYLTPDAGGATMRLVW